MLRREGCLMNKMRVRHLYRLEGLQLRKRVRRRKQIAVHRGREQRTLLSGVLYPRMR
jgi:putative transposase